MRYAVHLIAEALAVGKRTVEHTMVVQVTRFVVLVVVVHLDHTGRVCARHVLAGNRRCTAEVIASLFRRAFTCLAVQRDGLTTKTPLLAATTRLGTAALAVAPRPPLSPATVAAATCFCAWALARDAAVQRSRLRTCSCALRAT